VLVPPAIERERPNRRRLAEDLADIRNVFAGSRTKKPSLRARFKRFLDPALHPGIRDAAEQAQALLLGDLSRQSITSDLL
jgi:hypothetical protein